MFHLAAAAAGRLDTNSGQSNCPFVRRGFGAVDKARNSASNSQLADGTEQWTRSGRFVTPRSVRASPTAAVSAASHVTPLAFTRFYILRIHAIARISLLLLCAFPVAVAAREPQVPAKPLARLELAAGDAIVFLGDSITHQCLYTQYVEDYFYTRYPTMRLKLHNAGVGGAVAWDALQRFDDDVAAYHPKYVTILLGMNDGRYCPYNEEFFGTYRKDMTTLLDKLKGIGATAIPMTPTMFDARTLRLSVHRKTWASDSIALYNSVLAYYGTWLRDVAAQQGLGFVDMWSPLNNITMQQRKADAAFTLIPDAVHPSPPGHVVMAAAMVEDLGVPRQLSSIRLALAATGKNRVQAAGGTVSDLAVTDDKIEFTWLADALPWVVPEDAALGAELARMGHRFSREALTITGLRPGRYELTIDDQKVGTFTAAALARCIELQNNPKTPQYQQALAVAELNKQRNLGPVQSLRNEWGRFQGFARVRPAAKENPDNPQLEQQAAATAAKIKGLAERVEKLNAEAKQIEDKIFTVNRPKARRYVLKRR